jgi:hypothetical protein
MDGYKGHGLSVIMTVLQTSLNEVTAGRGINHVYLWDTMEFKSTSSN